MPTLPGGQVIDEKVFTPKGLEDFNKILNNLDKGTPVDLAPGVKQVEFAGIKAIFVDSKYAEASFKVPATGTAVIDLPNPIKITSGFKAAQIVVTGDASHTVVTKGGGDKVIVAGSGDLKMNTGAGSDTVEGGSGNEKIQVGVGRDSVNAGDGNDQVFGGDGNDSLLGGKGNDTISGGSGRDTIEGGQGDDFVMGGRGKDTFVFGNEQTGTDVIKDFTKGDVLKIADRSGDGKVDGADATFSQIGKDLYVQLKGGDVVILKDFKGDSSKLNEDGNPDGIFTIH